MFSNFEFRFKHKYLLWMKKAQDHVLQQRRTGYTRCDTESLRKPSERKGTAKKAKEEKKKGGGNTAKKTKSKGGKVRQMRKYLC